MLTKLVHGFTPPKWHAWTVNNGQRVDGKVVWSSKSAIVDGKYGTDEFLLAGKDGTQNVDDGRIKGGR